MTQVSQTEEGEAGGGAASLHVTARLGDEAAAHRKRGQGGPVCVCECVRLKVKVKGKNKQTPGPFRKICIMQQTRID